MKAHGLARLGKDVEVRNTTSGEIVAQLSLAFTYRQKNERMTQWVDGTLWGKRAEALAPYLLKGRLVMVDLEDVHVETYEGKNGPAVKVVARVVDVGLTGGGEDRQQQGDPIKTPPAQRKPAAKGGSGFDDMDDDLPF